MTWTGVWDERLGPWDVWCKEETVGQGIIRDGYTPGPDSSDVPTSYHSLTRKENWRTKIFGVKSSLRSGTVTENQGPRSTRKRGGGLWTVSNGTTWGVFGVVVDPSRWKESADSGSRRPGEESRRSETPGDDITHHDGRQCRDTREQETKRKIQVVDNC